MNWLPRLLYIMLSLMMLLTVAIGKAVDSTENTSKSYYPRENQTPLIIEPHQLKWNKIDIFPGAYCAVISGDPFKEGRYAVRLKFPPNYKINSNWQTATVNVTIISGSIHIGVGDKFDKNKGKTLRAASSIIIPSKSRLYFWTENEEAVLEIQGLGPWGVQFVDPDHDPRFLPK